MEHNEKMMNAARLRSEIEELFNETEGAFQTLTNFAPEVTSCYGYVPTITTILYFPGEKERTGGSRDRFEETTACVGGHR